MLSHIETEVGGSEAQSLAWRGLGEGWGEKFWEEPQVLRETYSFESQHLTVVSLFKLLISSWFNFGVLGGI